MKLWLPSCPSKTVIDATYHHDSLATYKHTQECQDMLVQLQKTMATSLHKHVIVLIVHVYMIIVHDTASASETNVSINDGTASYMLQLKLQLRKLFFITSMSFVVLERSCY